MATRKITETIKNFVSGKHSKHKIIPFEVDFSYSMPGHVLRGMRVRVSSTIGDFRTILPIGGTIHGCLVIKAATTRTITIINNGNVERLKWSDFVCLYFTNMWYSSVEYKEIIERKKQKQQKRTYREHTRYYYNHDDEPAKNSQANKKYKSHLSKVEIDTLLNKIAKIRPLADRPGYAGEGDAAKAAIKRLEEQLYA